MKFRILWPFYFFLLIAPFTPKIDLYVSHFFYSEGHFQNNVFFRFLFEYGEIFGFFVSGCCCLCFLGSFVKKKWLVVRKPALAMILTFVIGAGILTNALLKEYWGRPRPKQVTEFGGSHAYRPFWNPNFHTKNDPQKSFPSGHVAMGFYFLSLVLIGRRLKNKPILYLGIFLTAFLGGGLMLTRVAQGGHFLSDVLAAPVLMWFVAIGVDRALFVLRLDDRLLTWVGLGKMAHEAKLAGTSPKLGDV